MKTRWRQIIRAQRLTVYKPVAMMFRAYGQTHVVAVDPREVEKHKEWGWEVL